MLTRVQLQQILKPLSDEELEARQKEVVMAALVKAKATQNSDGSWSCDGDVDLSDLGLRRFPVRFKRVGGNFDCTYNQLQTLEGAPEEVGGGFYCMHNQLQTLKGAPRTVGLNFYCAHNELQTLEGAPEEVGGMFDCFANPVPAEELKRTIKRAYLK